MELLSPAGNFEKLRYALAYGADAVYVGGKNWSLRAFSENFSDDELAEATRYVHQRGKKIYAAANVYPRDEDFPRLEKYLRFLSDIGVDAVLVADLGAFATARKVAPNLSVHVSTQANVVNVAAVNAWRELGAERVVLARELECRQIAAIRRKTSAELEVFVHGAMCMAYSGRCMLSAYMANSDANLGECRQPCRWKYAVSEEKRAGQYFPVAEDERGTYVFNSKDLCLLPCLPDLFACGADSLKIEGRMKTVHYAATVTKVYREAIDAYVADPQNFAVKTEWLAELDKVSHREYWTGFFAGKDSVADGQIRASSSYLRTADFVGVVKGFDEMSRMAIVEQRGKFSLGQTIEILLPVGKNVTIRLTRMFDENDREISSAPHARQTVKIPVTEPLPTMSVLRVATEKDTDTLRGV